jgi:helicase
MGINTPATQVIVRDTVFHGAGRLGMTDILQMIGRAGRGNAEGTGCVICSPSEGGSTYADEFKSGTIELLEPQLIRNHHKGWKKKAKDSDERPDPLRAALLGEIARQPQTRLEHLEDFLGHSFSAWCEGKNKYDTTADLNFLERGKLIYRVENTESTYSATKLGRTVVFSGLSPESGAMLASFIRALINLGEKSSEGQPKKSYLRRLRELDLLFMSLASLEARSHLVRSTSSKSRAQVEEYIESLGPEDKPLLNLWRSASSAEYPTRRLISSLKFGLNGGDEESEAIFYRLMATAILLYRHAKGESLQSLSNEYRVHPGALESGLKYTVTWILNCLAQICSPDKCYKLDFIAMRAYALLEDLSLGASLGKLMSIKGVGRRSVDKLVTKGYVTLDDVCQLTENEILGLGIKKDQAKRIARFLRRSNR